MLHTSKRYCACVFVLFCFARWELKGVKYLAMVSKTFTLLSYNGVQSVAALLKHLSIVCWCFGFLTHCSAHWNAKACRNGMIPQNGKILSAARTFSLLACSSRFFFCCCCFIVVLASVSFTYSTFCSSQIRMYYCNVVVGSYIDLEAVLPPSLPVKSCTTSA